MLLLLYLTKRRGSAIIIKLSHDGAGVKVSERAKEKQEAERELDGGRANLFKESSLDKEFKM